GDVAEILDILGDYARRQTWFHTDGDARREVYARYAETLSPAICSRLWQDLESSLPAAEKREERDEEYSRECAKRIIQLQSFVDSNYAPINNGFGRSSQGFATFLGNLVEQYSA